MGRLEGSNLERFLRSSAAAEPIKMELRIVGDILPEILATIDGRGESCKDDEDVFCRPLFPLRITKASS